MFKIEKKIQMPKSKNEEISLPFSGEGTKMAYLEFRAKMPNLAKIAIFWKLRQVEVSASDVLLGIYLTEVLIFF